MRLNEGLFEDSVLYEIKGYYDSNFMELDESDVAYDLEDAFEIAWEYLSNGDYVVEIVDTDTGKRIVWEPDILDEFDGEFPYDNMVKLMQKSVERNMGESMKRKSNKALKESLYEDTDRKLFKEFKVFVDGRLFEISHTEQRKDEIVKILSNIYPDSNIEVKPYRHYESGYERKKLERIIANQLKEYGVEESLKESLTKEKRIKIIKDLRTAWDALEDAYFDVDTYVDNKELVKELLGIIDSLDTFIREFRVEKTIDESMNRIHRRALNEDLPREKRGPFFTDLYRAIANVIFKYDTEAEETGGERPSKADIEFGLDAFKRNFFKWSTYRESLTNRPRRTVNESLREDVRKEWKPNLNFKHIKDVLENALSRGKYVNNEREEVLAAIELCDKKQKYTPEQRKFIRDSHEKMWRKNKDESLYEDFDSDSARNKCKEFYRELKWDLPEGDNADLPNNVVKAFEKAGGRCRISRKTPKGFKYDGDVKGFTISGNIFLNSLQSDLNRLAEDLTMAYYVSLGGERQYIPDFIRSLMNESMNEDYEDFHAGDKFRLSFPEGDSSEITISDVHNNGKVKFKYDHPDYGTYNSGQWNSDEFKKLLNYSNYKKVDESLKEYIDFETLSNESLPLVKEGDHLVDGNEDWKILEIEDTGNTILSKGSRIWFVVTNKDGVDMYTSAKRFYGYKIVENDKAMNEDLEPEAIDEPEKAEITWVDDSGEQKVSTVELINKSFPETALKFSQEHDDCSIINCTAPLKGAQREDEPEKVALTESEETDGLANLISNEINGEFETTNGYRNLRQAASEIAPDMLPVIDDIMDEENTHVGQLQTLLSMVDDSADNIDVGAEEAEDQLEDEDAEIEHNDEVDVDFADIKKSDDEDADLEVKDDFDFDDAPFDEE